MSAVERELAIDVAAYIAGLIDGEGTITLSRLHAGERRRLAITIANNELRLLRFVLQSVGAGKITRKRSVCARHAPAYTYAITSRQALRLLAQVAPWLQSYKRFRAELAIARYIELTPRNGKYSAGIASRRRAFETDFLAIGPHSS